MLDLYVNYDCDVACTNLFEELCRSLCRNAVPETGPLTTLHVLSLEGVLAVVENMARRWVEALTNMMSFFVDVCMCFAVAAAVAAAVVAAVADVADFADAIQCCRCFFEHVFCSLSALCPMPLSATPPSQVSPYVC
jgi:hypothetical protein